MELLAIVFFLSVFLVCVTFNECSRRNHVYNHRVLDLRYREKRVAD